MISASSASLLLLAILLPSTVSQAAELRKVSPVLWERSSTRVLGEQIDVMLEIGLCNPCKLGKRPEQAAQCIREHAKLMRPVEDLVRTRAKNNESYRLNRFVGFMYPINLLGWAPKKFEWHADQRVDDRGIPAHEELMDQQLAGLCQNLSALIKHLDRQSLLGPLWSLEDTIQERIQKMKTLASSNEDNLVGFFNQLLPDYTAELVNGSYLQSLSSRAVGHLRFRLIARRQVDGVDVYRAKAFSFWQSPLGSARLMEYRGSPYVLYNRNSNCAKSLTDVDENTVSLVDGVANHTCHQANYLDPQLQNWVEKKTNETSVQTSYLPGHESTYIYCFRHNITIAGVEHECPPWAFELLKDDRWNSSDAVTDGWKPRRFTTILDPLRRFGQSSDPYRLN